jgi:phosphoribosyl-ATP pyrophosphohydrolase
MADLGKTDAISTVLAQLAETIDARAGADPGTSYTAKLLAKGERKCAQKLVEEAGELAIALASEGEDEAASEAADLLYHLLVALRSRGISLDTVAEKLSARQGVSGLAEIASRKD